MLENKTNHHFELLARVLGEAKRRIGLSRLVHFRVAVRISKSVKVETPDIPTRIAKRIAPRIAIETVRNRESRRKCRAVDIQHRQRGLLPLRSRRQAAHEEFQIRSRA